MTIIHNQQPLETLVVRNGGKEQLCGTPRAAIQAVVLYANVGLVD